MAAGSLLHRLSRNGLIESWVRLRTANQVHRERHELTLNGHGVVPSELRLINLLELYHSQAPDSECGRRLRDRWHGHSVNEFT